MRVLPSEFADLEKFVGDWALPTEQKRFEKRVSSSLAEVKNFNDTLYSRIEDVINYLNKHDIKDFPEDAKHLFWMAQSYMETSHPVDLGWKTTDLDDAFPSDRFEFVPPSA